jgi:hypothetical protein
VNTLLLDTNWDIALDANGNIALASPPYAIAQDAASAVKTIAGECWYDTTLGVPYNRILGKTPPLQSVKAAFVKEALRVPDVTSAKCFLESIGNRAISGQLQVTDATGVTVVVGF